MSFLKRDCMGCLVAVPTYPAMSTKLEPRPPGSHFPKINWSNMKWGNFAALEKNFAQSENSRKSLNNFAPMKPDNQNERFFWQLGRIWCRILSRQSQNLSSFRIAFMIVPLPLADSNVMSESHASDVHIICPGHWPPVCPRSWTLNVPGKSTAYENQA